MKQAAKELMQHIDDCVRTSDSQLARNVTQLLRNHGYKYSEVVKLFSDRTGINAVEYEELING